MAGKILITGLANSGKTSLLRPLKDCLVIARDGKPFSLPLPHVDVMEFEGVDALIDLVSSKIDAYTEKLGHAPRTIVFDSASRIFTDIETNCSRKYKGFDVWSNVNKEINSFCDMVNDLTAGGFNVILISHCAWDEKAGKYIETCKGSFAKIGGFLSTVDYALNIDLKGSKRIVTHRGNSLSRTLLEDMPDQQDVKEFNLQDYLEKIEAQANEVAEKWSI